MLLASRGKARDAGQPHSAQAGPHPHGPSGPVAAVKVEKLFWVEGLRCWRQWSHGAELVKPRWLAPPQALSQQVWAGPGVWVFNKGAASGAQGAHRWAGPRSYR